LKCFHLKFYKISDKNRTGGGGPGGNGFTSSPFTEIWLENELIRWAHPCIPGVSGSGAPKPNGIDEPKPRGLELECGGCQQNEADEDVPNAN